MSQEFHAIYENGVLRPLVPLCLPESAEVTGTLHVTNGKDVSAESKTLAQQQSALDAMFSIVDRIPQVARGDGLSNRDHDLILYGKRN